MGKAGPCLGVAEVSVGNGGGVASGELEWVYWCAVMENGQLGWIYVEPSCSIVDSGFVGYRKASCLNKGLKNLEGV